MKKKKLKTAAEIRKRERERVSRWREKKKAELLEYKNISQYERKTNS